MDKLPNNFEDDAKKYFDDRKYRTLIVGKDGFKSSDDLREAIEAIADGKTTTEERYELLKSLEISTPKVTLIEAIRKEKDNDKKARLISACWEVNVDCTEEFLYFVELTCSDSFNVSLEALTVIENIENEIPIVELDKARQMISEKIKQRPENIDLLVDLLEIIKHK